jgi:hypothetical protein
MTATQADVDVVVNRAIFLLRIPNKTEAILAEIGVALRHAAIISELVQTKESNHAPCN